MDQELIESKIAQIVENNPQLAAVSYQLANTALNALKSDPEFMAAWKNLDFGEQLYNFDTIMGFIEEKFGG